MLKSISERKLKKTYWTPAKYDIPDVIAELKLRGVNPPKNLYSGSAVHVSSKKPWMKKIMSSPLQGKSLPPKEYHSRLKWLENMEKHSNNDVQKNMTLSKISLSDCSKIARTTR